MPLAIILVAGGLIAAGIRGSYKDLFKLLVGDFTGSGNFLNWLAAVALVGCLGYVPRLQSFSRAFIALILVAVFLKQGTGVFDNLVSAINTTAPDSAHPNPGADPNGGGSGGTSQSSDFFGGLLSSATGGLPGLGPAITSITKSFSAGSTEPGSAAAATGTAPGSIGSFLLP